VTVENQFLEVDEKAGNINPMVLVSGIVYGRGEDNFYPLFQELLGPSDTI
jgi:hypothetical protein